MSCISALLYDYISGPLKYKFNFLKVLSFYKNLLENEVNFQCNHDV